MPLEHDAGALTLDKVIERLETLLIWLDDKNFAMAAIDVNQALEKLHAERRKIDGGAADGGRWRGDEHLRS